jgi:hypothetical protein
MSRFLIAASAAAVVAAAGMFGHAAAATGAKSSTSARGTTITIIAIMCTATSTGAIGVRLTTRRSRIPITTDTGTTARPTSRASACGGEPMKKARAMRAFLLGGALSCVAG